MAEISYQKQVEIDNIEKIRSICDELPSYVKTFFRGIQQTHSSRSRLVYARDIKAFFEYIFENDDKKYDSLKSISFEDLSRLEFDFIQDYMDYLQHYKKDGKTFQNNNTTIKRKLSSLRVFFGYLYKHELITNNAVAKVDMPKLRDKQITRMDAAEVANFLDTVEYGNRLTAGQMRFHDKTKTRDLALLTLMLSTGIRISECVGLDINDVDFNNMCIRIIRKGGKEALVYFSDEASFYLEAYIAERKTIDACSGSENALFLSSQRKRIAVRSVENLVKKYSLSSVPLKHITPHKLRSTYGTALYQETGDIYLVADVLGHSDVNTTRKHYADIENERKRSARNKVTLREKLDDNK